MGVGRSLLFSLRSLRPLCFLHSVIWRRDPQLTRMRKSVPAGARSGPTSIRSGSRSSVSHHGVSQWGIAMRCSTGSPQGLQLGDHGVHGRVDGSRHGGGQTGAHLQVLGDDADQDDGLGKASGKVGDLEYVADGRLVGTEAGPAGDTGEQFRAIQAAQSARRTGPMDGIDKKGGAPFDDVVHQIQPGGSDVYGFHVAGKPNRLRQTARGRLGRSRRRTRTRCRCRARRPGRREKGS
jgi:hypothetical protein